MSTGGCGYRTASIDRYVPKSDVAHEALEAALTAWQNGEPAGEIRGRSVPVQVVDTHRRADQRLVTFEILGEVGCDTGRCFAVRLALDNPTEEKKARFVMIGLSPLWVFREEDYTMLSHWEHAMPDDATKEANEKAGK
jgi:hypothetical protein